MSESLAKVAAGGFKVPTALQQPTAPIVSSLQWAPYVSFVHPKRADEWAKVCAKFRGVQEGTPYYVDGDDIRSLEGGFKCSYVCGLQYWAKKTAAGDLLGFSREPVGDEDWREHVEAVLLLYLQDKVVPANVQFHTTKCGAAKTMDEALRLAATPEWGRQGPEHLVTMQIPQPFLRFYAELTLGAPRNSRRTGLPYRTLHAAVYPTMSAEWARLSAIGEADAQRLFQLAADRYEYVLKELESKEV